MPLPKTSDVGKVMHFLKNDKPGMPRKQKIAIALSQTRKYDSDIVGKAVDRERKK